MPDPRGRRRILNWRENTWRGTRSRARRLPPARRPNRFRSQGAGRYVSGHTPRIAPLDALVPDRTKHADWTESTRTFRSANLPRRGIRDMTIAAPDTKRRALGKGLDSLLPRVQPTNPVQSSSEGGEGGKPREISVDMIDRNPFQTR